MSVPISQEQFTIGIIGTHRWPRCRVWSQSNWR